MTTSTSPKITFIESPDFMPVRESHDLMLSELSDLVQELGDQELDGQAFRIATVRSLCNLAAALQCQCEEYVYDHNKAAQVSGEQAATFLRGITEPAPKPVEVAAEIVPEVTPLLHRIYAETHGSDDTGCDCPSDCSEAGVCLKEHDAVQAMFGARPNGKVILVGVDGVGTLPAPLDKVIDVLHAVATKKKMELDNGKISDRKRMDFLSHVRPVATMMLTSIQSLFPELKEHKAPLELYLTSAIKETMDLICKDCQNGVDAAMVLFRFQEHLGAALSPVKLLDVVEKYLAVH